MTSLISIEPERVVHVFEPGCDGVFKHVDKLARDQLKRGMFVGLAFSSIRGSAQLTDLLETMKASRGALCDLRVGRTPSLKDLRAFLWLLVFLLRIKPQIVHCHSSKAGILGRAAAAVVRVPTIYTPHAYYGMGKKGGARSALFNGLERLFAGLAHTSNVSEDEAAFAREQLGIKQSQITVIPNATDTEIFKPATAEEKVRCRRVKGLPVDAIVFGNLGRLSYQKDPLTLYRAFATVARNHPIAYLAHLGTGELVGECEKWIQSSGLRERIVRMDYLQDPSDFYRSLDGFVLSSRYEGLSIAVLEALATDLPLVLTDVPGNRDFLRLGLSHVWSAPAEDPDALAAAMESCLLDLENRRPSNHRAVALERFSEEVCFGKTLDLYREIVESRRKQHSLASSA